MNRRSFLTSSLRGLILGAAMSSGLGKVALDLINEPEFVDITSTIKHYSIHYAISEGGVDRLV